MDLVLVGLPGQRQERRRSAPGRAPRRRVHRPRREIESAAGRPDRGDLRRRGRAGLPGPRAGRRPRPGRTARPRRGLDRVIATGGGAPVDTRNRWRLYRGRTLVWLDGTPGGAGRSGSGAARNPRPLVAGPDPVGTIRRLAADRERFYAAGHRVDGVAAVGGVVAGGRGDPRPGAAGRRRCSASPTRGSAGSCWARGSRWAVVDGTPAARRAGRSSSRSPEPGPRSARRLAAGRPGRPGRGAGRPAAGRGRQAPAGRGDGGARSSPDCASSAANRSWRSVAAPSATRPASSPRPTCAACRSSTSRRRWSPRSTARSAARRPWTCPRARTSSARSTSRRP